MTKSKVQKRNEARKNAEALKAKRKADRAKSGTAGMNGPAKKGKSLVPQSKKGKK